MLGFAIGTMRPLPILAVLTAAAAANETYGALAQKVSSNVHSDEEQIHHVIATWQAATKAGDVDAVLGLMTDDVVFLVPGRTPMHKAEFEALSRVPPGKQAPHIQIASEIQEVQISGDLAFAWTKLSVSITPRGAAQSMERAGYTLSVFRRVAGQWLLARDANLLAPVHPKS